MTAVLEGYLFYEIAALLVLAAGVGFVGLMLRQPLIVSFIAVGIIAGPSVLNIARSDAQIDLLAELGIAVLLFLVGPETRLQPRPHAWPRGAGDGGWVRSSSQRFSDS